MAHACAIPGCGRSAKNGQLMCWPHWRRVPRALNRAVFDTYRAMSDDYSVGFPARTGAYRQARDAAIAAVVEKEAVEA